MSKEIKPINDRVLVKPIECFSKSAQGIILHGKGKTEFLHGKVLAVGTGRSMPNGQRAPIDVAVGDTVIYGNVANTVEDELNGEKVLLIVDQAIIAIVKD